MKTFNTKVHLLAERVLHERVILTETTSDPEVYKCTLQGHVVKYVNVRLLKPTHAPVQVLTPEVIANVDEPGSAPKKRRSKAKKK